MDQETKIMRTKMLSEITLNRVRAIIRHIVLEATKENQCQQ